MEPLPWLKPYQQMTKIGHQSLLHSAGDRTFKSVDEAYGRSGQNVGVHARDYFAELPELPERVKKTEGKNNQLRTMNH